MMFEYFKAYWDWADQNAEKANATTAAIYFYFLHLANSLRWKESFGITAGQTMAAVGIGSVKTYRKHFDELIESGLIEIRKRSINQYSCHVIALPKITEAVTQAMTQAGVEHLPKQGSGTYPSSDPSSDPIHKTNKTVKTEKTTKTKGADLNKVYSENESVNKHFIEFLKNRIEIKKPATQRAADLLVSEMRKLYKTPDEAIQGINQSIMKGWTGLFPIGSQNIKPEPPKTFNRSSANHYV
jgi:hypothetical protein